MKTLVIFEVWYRPSLFLRTNGPGPMCNLSGPLGTQVCKGGLAQMMASVHPRPEHEHFWVSTLPSLRGPLCLS